MNLRLLFPAAARCTGPMAFFIAFPPERQYTMDALIMALCANTGITLFGIVDQDYSLSKEMIESLGLKVVDLKVNDLKTNAGLSDIASILSFGNQELSGTAELLDTAREYAINKMIIKAADMGANAIVGIDSESSMGSGIMHITIYGTAVNVERIEPADSQ